MPVTLVDSLTPTGAVVAYLAADVMLAALATGGVWEEPAPQEATPVVVGQAPPVFVTVRLQADTMGRCGGGGRWHGALYAVQAVGVAERIEAVEAAAVRLDALLMRSRDEGRVLIGWHVMGLGLEQPIEYPDVETETGLRWLHRGGLYRLLAEAA
jgi:hypothetical protein